MTIQVTFHHEGHNSPFTYSTPMEVVPRVDDQIDFPEFGGLFKVRKVIWRPNLHDGVHEPHLEVRKPWASEW